MVPPRLRRPHGRYERAYQPGQAVEVFGVEELLEEPLRLAWGDRGTWPGLQDELRGVSPDDRRASSTPVQQGGSDGQHPPY